MDAVSNFPAVMASTDLRHGDTADDFVSSTAGSQTAVFALGRQNSHETRDLLTQILTSSKDNVTHVLQNRVDVERSLAALATKMETCCSAVALGFCAQKEAATAAELARLRDQSIADKFAALEAAIKSLSPPPAP